MRFVKTDDLKPGMRIAKPIYNRMGVMLYERDTQLTQQGINSIINFGLIGIFILEPAEPVPPITREELDFEQFQTIAMFQLRDDMIMLKNNKAPKQLPALVEDILKRYGSLDHKLIFTQNIRSSTDFVYKHAVSCAILAALIGNTLKLSHNAHTALVYAALLYDFGLLLTPPRLFEKGDDLTDDEKEELHSYKLKGLNYIDPGANPYDFPENALDTMRQVIQSNIDPMVPLPAHPNFSKLTSILQVIDKFDSLTSMSLTREPVSEILAMRFLMEFPEYYPHSIVNALAGSIHILPVGASVDLSNGHKALVVAENPSYFLSPVLLDFKTNELIDLSKPEVSDEIQIEDIMKTMDNRIAIDRVSLELFSADERIVEITEHFRLKKIELERRAKEREERKRKMSAEQEAAHKAELERLKNTPVDWNKNKQKRKAAAKAVEDDPLDALFGSDDIDTTDGSDDDSDIFLF